MYWRKRLKRHGLDMLFALWAATALLSTLFGGIGAVSTDNGAVFRLVLALGLCLTLAMVETFVAVAIVLCVRELVADARTRRDEEWTDRPPPP